jgi:hypothetical protein
MRLLRFKRAALYLLLTLACSCQTADPGGHHKVRIDPKLSENDIRGEMLRYTPIGTDDEEVFKFASNRLKHGHGAPVYDRPNTLSVLLGSSTRIFGLDDTWVQWRFDSEHKLVGIDVIKSRDTL